VNKGRALEAESNFKPDRPPTPHPEKNSPDLHQSEEHPLAKVGWTCSSRDDDSGYRYEERTENADVDKDWKNNEKDKDFTCNL